ncbi:hypothetical protein GCM10027037_09420 [Mucilaginibacter koreensis]
MVLFQYLINRSDAFVEQQISKGLYNVHDLVEVKVPVHLPQIEDWNGYEPVSGQVQLNGGSCYNYVKLKMTRDTLYIMCIPNYKTTRLTNANIIYARQVSDTPLNKKGTTTTLKTFSYNAYQHFAYTYSIKPPVILVKTYSTFVPSFIPTGFTNSLDQPPQLIG